MIVHSQSSVKSSFFPKSDHRPRIRRKQKKIEVENARGAWSSSEQKLFIDGMDLFGNSWKDVAALVKTRTASQCRSHAQKHFKRKCREQAREMRNNPKTKNHIFVVVKQYYNTVLVQKKRILSYQPNNTVHKDEREKQNEQEDVEDKGKGKKYEDIVSGSDSKSIINNTNLSKKRKITEESDKNGRELDRGPIIYCSVVYNPIQCFQFPMVNPAHYNPFKRDAWILNNGI